MEILGVGGPEFFFIVALAIIFIGPKRMGEVATTVGRFLNKIVKSEAWMVLREISNAIVHAPNRMMREANLEELQRELSLTGTAPRVSVLPATANPPAGPDGEAGAENSILPPRSQSYSATPPPPPAPVKKSPAKTAPTKKTVPVKKTAPRKTNQAKLKPAAPKGKKRSDA
jgi:Sec-independent protein translocase protein TatA